MAFLQCVVAGLTLVIALLALAAARQALSVAGGQLDAAVRVAKADFISGLSRDFFTPGNRELFTWIEIGCLVFHPPTESGQVGFFSVDAVAARRRLPMRLAQKLRAADAVFSELEVDDLLGCFESVGQFYFRGRIEKSDAYDFFSYYVDKLARDKAIRDYIAWTQAQESRKDCYCYLVKLFRADLRPDRSKVLYHPGIAEDPTTK